MKRYIERIWELMIDEKTKYHVPMYDEVTPKGVSYEQLCDISGRLYAYLKSHNIGKEDFDDQTASRCTARYCHDRRVARGRGICDCGGNNGSGTSRLHL